MADQPHLRPADPQGLTRTARAALNVRGTTDAYTIKPKWVAPSDRRFYMPSYGAAVFGCIVAIARLLAYAIDNRDRWRRLLVLIALALTVSLGWWLLARGGVQVIVHDFSPASVAHRRSGPG